SDRFVQLANRCISSSVRPSPSSTTATGLPRYGAVVNTSTWLNGRERGIALRYPRAGGSSLGARRCARPARAGVLAGRRGGGSRRGEAAGADARPDRRGTAAGAVLRAGGARLVLPAAAAHADAQGHVRRRAPAGG